MSAAARHELRTVRRMRKPPADIRTVVVQLLALPVTTHDEQRGFSYKGILTFSTTSGSAFGSTRTIFCTPVPPRLTANQVAAATLNELELAGVLPPNTNVISVPVIEITPDYAAEILSAFRSETEHLLRRREIDMLNTMWELPSDVGPAPSPEEPF
jgi:hypothetical protein